MTIPPRLAVTDVASAITFYKELCVDVYGLTEDETAWTMAIKSGDAESIATFGLLFGTSGLDLLEQLLRAGEILPRAVRTVMRRPGYATSSASPTSIPS
jgi:hypothetical protein